MGSGSPAELLATGKAYSAVQENKETKERMLQLVISSLVLGSAVAAPQDYQSYLSQLHQYRMEYLPESVNSYINKTWGEGRDVAYDLYDDIKEVRRPRGGAGEGGRGGREPAGGRREDDPGHDPLAQADDGRCC